SAPTRDKLMLRAVSIIGRPFGVHKFLVPDTEPTYYAAVNPFDGNELTNDADHYAMFQSHLNAQPNLGLGGPTIHWAVEAIKEIDVLMNASVPDIPILTFRGTQETVVDGDAIEARALTLPNTRLEIVEGGKHEVWMETPKIQTKVWDVMDHFLGQIL
ncbi:MAG: alpha/beta hydrolase, partial [Amylibacter sp.]